MPKRMVAKPSVSVGYSVDSGTEGLGTLFLLGFNKSVELGHVLVVNNDQTTVVVSVNSRQDHATAWGVMVAQFDGDVLVRSGLTKASKDPAKAVNKALRKLLPGCHAGRCEHMVYEEEDVDEDRLGFGTAGENNKGKRRKSRAMKITSAGTMRGGALTNVPVT